jgi:hypothetical protein
VSAPAPAPAARSPLDPRWARRTDVFIAVVVIVAAGLTLALWSLTPIPRGVDGMLVLGLLAGWATLAAIGNRVRAPVTLSAIGTLTLVALPALGPAAGTAVAFAGSIIGFSRLPRRRLVFNTAMRTAMSAAGGFTFAGCVHAFGGAGSADSRLGLVTFALVAADVVQCLANAALVGGVVAISQRVQWRGQVAALLTSSGLGYIAQGGVALLLYVLWVPAGLGLVGGLVFTAPSLWASRWSLAQYGRQARAREGTLAALVTAIEVRSPSAARHTAAVANLCGQLAEELALPADEVDMVKTAGTLHDLDVLTVDQGRHGHGHGTGLAPTRAMGEVTFLAVARPALEFQRVPFADGTLPKSAAILAVADGYILARDGDGTQEALGERAGFAAVRRESGTRYDPSVVDALGRLLRRARP